jgi:adenine-specific DNA-methyltransferase
MAGRLRLFSLPDCQPQLSRQARRATGVYYTPPEIVRLIVDLALAPLLSESSPPNVLDLACGAGEFLREAHRRLRARFGPKAARAAVHGIDIDPTAVANARRRLRQRDPEIISSQIRIGDALDSSILEPASFDVILGNPPYVNIRQLAKTASRDEIERLRRRFQSARGNFDLYTLFIERALELLGPGGRCGLIVPNKWATLDYARPCRELLLAMTTIERVIDLSDAKAFAGTSVYPQVIVFRKQPPSATHAVLIQPTECNEPLLMPQRSLSAAAIHLAHSLEVESRVATQPLGQVAALACGTAGYSAQRLARRLIDSRASAANEGQFADFITSGNIDRYAIRVGGVRYLHRDYVRPQLPLNIPELTAAKRSLFAGPKIVIAGMSRRLEAAWDEHGLALGVQVFAASRFQLDPFFLLALLNSKLLSYLFATRYAAKRLGGGYLAINKGQLARLPVRVAAGSDRGDQKRVNQLIEAASAWDESRDAPIDRLVYELYGVSEAQIAHVESHFAAPMRSAA